jgi:glycerol-3-phosphate dehydrogenase
VTDREVKAALGAAVPPGTLGGLKRRTRAMMGRCQGFNCMAAVRSLAPALMQGV